MVGALKEPAHLLLFCFVFVDIGIVTITNNSGVVQCNCSVFVQVLKLAVTTRADGGTAPAASLWPFYERKEVVKTFIIVTDEEENTSYKNY